MLSINCYNFLIVQLNGGVNDSIFTRPFSYHRERVALEGGIDRIRRVRLIVECVDLKYLLF